MHTCRQRSAMYIKFGGGEYDRDQAHAQKTRREAKYAIDLFLNSLESGAKTQLRDVRAAQVDAWVNAVEGRRMGAKLSARSRNKMRAYVSSFLSWAARRYDLASNPMDNSVPASGERRNPENIVAIRSEAQIRAVIAAFKPDIYWQAVVAVGVLAGPRYKELVSIRIDSVHLDERYLILTGWKTGRQRRVQIEGSVLAGILKRYLKWRSVQRGGVWETGWLFPSTVEPNEWKPRYKSEPGIWSDNGVFLDELRRRRVLIYRAGGVWDYGPWEWRHTFGTILGHCGMTSREIANAMGNSEKVAADHYVLPGRMGDRWGFLY